MNYLEIKKHIRTDNEDLLKFMKTEEILWLQKHFKFIQKHNLEIKLASDEDGKLCEMFGVWVEKSMYGKKYMGIERSTFLFDEKLFLVHAWERYI